MSVKLHQHHHRRGSSGSSGSSGKSGSGGPASPSSAVAKATADEALAALEKETRALFNLDTVVFEDLDTAMREAAATGTAGSSEAVVFIALGASWSLPCRFCFANLAAACAVYSKSSAKVLLVDHEMFRGFYPEVVVGVPVVSATCGGRPVLFRAVAVVVAPVPCQSPLATALAR
jgi:hypothetical protein